MKYAIGFLVLALVSGCATSRTKYTDRTLRIMVDPDHIDVNNYFKLQKALVASGSFTVVDRKQGFMAIKKEQERLHRNEVDRYEDKQKWAHWGKLYGVGGIIVPHNECQRVESGPLFKPGPRVRCHQYLSILDANTGEVLVVAQDDVYSDRMVNVYDNNYLASEWDNVVELLMDNYPKKFEKREDHEMIANYKRESEQHAQDQQKKVQADRKIAADEQATAEAKAKSEKEQFVKANIIPESKKE
jgi:hypothetical protein